MNPLTIYVVYKNPSDYPGKFVTRAQYVYGRQVHIDPLPAIVSDTLEDARSIIPRTCFKLDRHPQDEPQILETWL